MYLNLHNIVTVELINEPKPISDYLTKAISLDIFQAEKKNNAITDITLIFVDKLDSLGPFKLIDNSAGHDNDHFYFIDKSGYKLCWPLETRNIPLLMTCEAGISPFELHRILEQFIQLSMLEKRLVFIHASAAYYKGKAILFAGWSGTGKTIALLSFLNRGAQYIGNDRAIIDEDGQVFAYPVSLDLDEYYHKELAKLLPSSFVFRNSSQKIVRSSFMFLGRFAKLFPNITIRQLADEVYHRAERIGAKRLVKYRELYTQGSVIMKASLNVIFLLERSEGKHIEITPIKGNLVAKKMSRCFSYEMALHWGSQYHQFRFAFPDKTIGGMENIEILAEEIMTRAFYQKEIYSLALPEHFEVDDLFKKIVEYT